MAEDEKDQVEQDVAETLEDLEAEYNSGEDESALADEDEGVEGSGVQETALDPEMDEVFPMTGTADSGYKPDISTPVVRKKVTSKRVTPKGTQSQKISKKGPTRSRSEIEADGDYDHYVPNVASYARPPSPWYVPALMFGLLVIGALVIVANFAGLFGDPANSRTFIGLAFILGGIIAATQYR